jgi:hypothetical protein
VSYITRHGNALANIKAAAQVHGPEIIAALWHIVSAKSHKQGGGFVYDIGARLKAMSILLDRGYGRPAQDITVATKQDIDEYSDDELLVIAGVSASVDDADTQDAEANAADASTSDTSDAPGVPPHKLY